MFRSVALDGDGIPDEAQALAFVRSAGGAVAGAAGAVGGRVSGLSNRGKQEADVESADENAATTGTAQTPDIDVTASIVKLAALRDQGTLTEAEFTAKKSELLSRL